VPRTRKNLFTVSNSESPVSAPAGGTPLFDRTLALKNHVRIFVRRVALSSRLREIFRTGGRGADKPKGQHPLMLPSSLRVKFAGRRSGATAKAAERQQAKPAQAGQHQRGGFRDCGV